MVSPDLGSAGFEAMALGKPLLTYIPWSEEEYKKHLLGRPLPPIINVHKKEDVHEHLTAYEQNSEVYKSKGEEGKEWMLKYLGEPQMDRWVYIIECLYNKEPIDPDKLLFHS